MHVHVHGMHEGPSDSPAIMTVQIAKVSGEESGQGWQRWTLEIWDLLMCFTQCCHDKPQTCFSDEPCCMCRYFKGPETVQDIREVVVSLHDA